MTFLTSFPDLWFQVDELIGEGDDILVSGTLSGTHKGEFYGMARDRATRSPGPGAPSSASAAPRSSPAGRSSTRSG